MKLTIYVYMCMLFLITNSVKAQDTIMLKKPLFHPQPDGYAYIPSVKNKEPQNPKTNFAFYLSAQPVSQKDFVAFVKDLDTNNKTEEAKIARGAMVTEADNKSHAPVILRSDQTLILYAHWLSKKLSTKKVHAHCSILTFAQWRQAFVSGNPPKVNTIYGLVPTEGNEWILKDGASLLINHLGALVPEPTGGHFRLVLTYTSVTK